MSEVNLKVPYKSQWDSDAGKTNNDCGPTSIAMILNYYGENLTTNQVFEATGAGSGLINIDQMLKAIRSFGYNGKRLLNQSVASLKSYLDKNIPVIALIHYGALSSKQDSYNGAHFVVVVGYREDGFFVNDPDFYAPLRADGDHHFYTKEEFIRAWGSCNLDGNQNNSLIIIDRKEQSGSESTPMADELMQITKADFAKLMKNSESLDKIASLLGLEKNLDADKYLEAIKARTKTEIKEVIKEVKVEVPVEKIVYVYKDNPNLDDWEADGLVTKQVIDDIEYITNHKRKV